MFPWEETPILMIFVIPKLSKQLLPLIYVSLNSMFELYKGKKWLHSLWSFIEMPHIVLKDKEQLCTSMVDSQQCR